MPSRIRVLQLTVGFTVGGTELLIRDICRYINRERFEVEACCLKGPGPLVPEIAGTGSRVFALGGTHGIDPALCWRLYRLLRTGGYHILHSHLFLADLAARLAGRLVQIPVVLHSQHDTDVWMRPFHILASRITLPLADKVVAVSKSVLEDTVERLGVPRALYCVIHNGIDLSRFDASLDQRAGRDLLGLPHHRPVIGFVGRLLDSKKGISVLLEAVGRLEGRAGRRALVVLMGDGPDRHRLEATASELGLGSRAVFLGERMDALSLYGAFDVLAVPSLYEGFGLVCLEAMAAHRPVVASRVGGIPEIVKHGETGMLVPKNAPHALALALSRYLEDPALGKSHGEAGRRRVEEHFTVKRMVRAYEELYLDLAGAHPGRTEIEKRQTGDNP